MYRSKRRLPREQRQQIEDTLRKIHALFKKENWLACLDRTDDQEAQRSMLHAIGSNPYGRLDVVANVIYVDFRLDVLAMFIHQCIHAIHPKMFERDVTILELIVIENMTSEDAVGLLRLMLDHSMRKLFSHEKPPKTQLMLEIQKLFDSGHWLVGVDLLRGETDLSVVHDLGRWCCGFVDEGVRIMYVDFREDLLATFVHECLHAIYPEKSEQTIREMERAHMNQFTAPQAECLLSWMLQNLY